MIWGYHYFWKHPYQPINTTGVECHLLFTDVVGHPVFYEALEMIGFRSSHASPARWSWMDDWVVVPDIFYVHPYLGKIPILTNIFQMGWFNHQLDDLNKGFFCSEIRLKPKCASATNTFARWSDGGDFLFGHGLKHLVVSRIEEEMRFP